MIIHKLGKKPPKSDHRTLKMSNYRLPGITVPPEVSWASKVQKWGMMGNDLYGDCTCAAAGHMIEQWTTYAGRPFTPTNAEVLKVYEDPSVGDYKPGDPSTDNGATLLDVLKYWRKTGIAGHKIFAFVQVNLKNLNEVREAVYLFGNLYWGVQLPLSAQGQASWTVPEGNSPDGAPGSWGGHAVPIIGFTTHSLGCVTWGQVLSMTQGFFSSYGDEGWAVLSLDWIEKNGLSPSQFNLKQLEADLKIVTA